MSNLILIIDDNFQNRLILKDILEFHGFSVIQAENGTDGVRLARETQPDLILMDIQMPGMDGITAEELIKQDPATSNIKIIALTSMAMKGDREKLLEAGFDDYVAKPIDTRELPNLIKQHLSDVDVQQAPKTAAQPQQCRPTKAENIQTEQLPAKILVVDDNLQNRCLLEDVLSMQDFQVLLAENGRQGVDMAIEHLPDLILMDLQMPSMNGIEAAQILRGDSRTKDIRILVLSSYNSLDSGDDFFQTGFDGYLSKPIDILSLPDVINTYLYPWKT